RRSCRPSPPCYPTRPDRPAYCPRPGKGRCMTDVTWAIPVCIALVQTWIMVVQLRMMRQSTSAASGSRTSTTQSFVSRYWPLVVMGLLMLGAWVPYLLWASAPRPIRPVIRAASIPDMSSCSAELDGAQLLQYQYKYDVLLACGIMDPTI